MLFFVIVITIQAALLIKCPLYVFRQFFPRALPHFCLELNETQQSLDQQHIFTTVIYSILFLGRFLEALIIEIQIYKFFFDKKKEEIVAEILENVSAKLHGNCPIILLVIIAIYMTVHALLIASLGISLEVRHGHEKGCRSYPYQTYILYWILDAIRYGYDVLVRILLMIATVGIRNIWKSKDKRAEQHESSQPAKQVYADIIEDRDIVSSDHELKTKMYELKGRTVEIICDIFETWFSLPWIIFFIGSSLSTDQILRAWKDGKSPEATYDFPEIVYLVYNVSQLSFLIIPYLCSLLINRGHRKYLEDLRSNQLNQFTDFASMYAFASMQKIEKDIHFDFVPRVWGTSIKIAVDEPFFVFFVFIGVFFTICEALV